MSNETNKALVKRSVKEFYNGRNFDSISELYAPDYVSYDAAGFKSGGVTEMKQMMSEMYVSFPDFDLEINDLVAEGDKVVKRYTVRFTHQKEYKGIPATGNKVEMTGTDTYKIVDGKLAVNWSNADWLSMLQQLEAIPNL